jgi:hypothetical protein
MKQTSQVYKVSSGGKFASWASNDSCVEVIWKSFKEIVFNSIDHFVPYKILRKNPYPAYYN